MDVSTGLSIVEVFQYSRKSITGTLELELDHLSRSSAMKAEPEASEGSSQELKMHKTASVSYNYPYHFQILFNFMFVIGLSPFWVSLGNKQSAKLHEFFPQKVVCFVLHCLFCLVTFPSVRGSLKGEQIKTNPGIIFDLFGMTAWVSFIFTLTELLWLKKSCVLAFFQQVPRAKRKGRQMFIWSVILVGLVGEQLILEALYWATNLETGNTSISNYFTSTVIFGSQYLYGSFIIPLSEIYMPFASRSTGMKVLLILTHIVQKYQMIISSVVMLMGLIAAVFAHKIASTALNIHNQSMVDVSTSLSAYFTAKSNIGLIDDLARSGLFMSLVSLTTSISQYITQILDAPDISLTCVIFSNCAILGATMYYSAETNLKMKTSVKKIKQLYWKQETDKGKMSCVCSHYPARLIKDAPGTNGLSAGRFFTVTYSFTAQCLSIILTYTIIKVQFETKVSITNCK